MDVSMMTGIASQQAKNASATAQTDALKNKALNIKDNPTEEELKSTLKDFESYFVEQVLKEVKKTFTEFNGESGDNGMNQYRDLYMDKCIEMVADDITEDVGKNLTQQLYEQMKRNYNLD